MSFAQKIGLKLLFLNENVQKIDLIDDKLTFSTPKIIIFWALECLQCTLGNNSHGIDDENVFINDFCNKNMPLTGGFWSKWPEMAKNVYLST